jgi:FkbM family methyltransferase
MKFNYKYKIWKLFKNFGFEILPDEHKNSLQSYLLDLMNRYEINYILDVGSNQGQFYNVLRNIGYSGYIELFEPLIECHDYLKQITKNDKYVKLNTFALGDKNEKVKFYITENNVSSSILVPKDYSKVKKSYDVVVKAFDSLESDFSFYKSVLLKIDAQGYEKNVILGAINSLEYFQFILMELSLFTGYVGETTMIDMFEFMKKLNYTPIFIYPGVTNFSNEILQYEVVFKKMTQA